MKSLSPQGLITAYLSSIDLQLDKEFIHTLFLEIQKRKLNIDNLSTYHFESEKTADELIE
ncbi:sporulation histidine kinase inhibitor Sda [Paenibacillus frigoriresistens]|uniref:sporulation histidine kinase inhibitor Sda n=1 Tax=Paenibacillus alginolyticus TaxID=59839 RepID=UPI0015670814|nr:sporulation histidine kinase inhibitor Sda [Paenibacillus frigoriresistens]